MNHIFTLKQRWKSDRKSFARRSLSEDTYNVVRLGMLASYRINMESHL